MRITVVGWLGGMALPLLVSSALAATPQQAIRALNEQRTANGVPADIVEDGRWSDGCRLHMSYLRLNRLSLTHDEDPALPGYTELGAEAGHGSVLTDEAFTAPDRNPWEDAPIHLMQLLGPALSVTGYSDGCMWTFPGYQRPAPAAPTLYTYPGPGTRTIYPVQTVSEWPFAPGDFVGLPQGTKTGPHLYALGFGVQRGQITAASLTGPGGSVAVRTVDNSTSSARGDIGILLPPGGILIPVRPLKSARWYTASVTFAEFGGRTLVHGWSFRTAARASRRPYVRLRFFGRRISFRSRSQAPVRLIVRRLPSRQIVYRRTLSGAFARGFKLRISNGAGRYRACIRQRADRTYAPARRCSVSRVD
jgi:hypothetical protein